MKFYLLIQMLVEELGQKLNVILYDHDDAPRADEFLGRFLHIIKFLAI